MKKLFLTLLFILLGCPKVYSFDLFSDITFAEEHNPACMSMKKFKVFQVFGDNSALANDCTTDEKELFCFGAVVLLEPQRTIDYYDDMYISVPKDKCSVQNGVYRYEAKNGNLKTVPIIHFEYEKSATSEEEAISRVDEKLEDLRYMCKISAANDEDIENIQEVLEKCDCVVDTGKEEFLQAVKGNNRNIDKDEFEKNFSKNVKKKCGELSK